MNVRAVVTEVLAIAMTAIFFVNIFIDSPFGIWGRVGAFLAFLILAYYLIRGVLNEARQREELDGLNHTLEARVAAQTVEVRRSYEAEKRARIDLEKLNDAKDQFIMMTQHHLRGPVSSIAHADSLDAAKQSGARLSRIVDDFLDITALKPGASILDVRSVSLRPAVADILDELRMPIEKMGLRIEWPQDDAHWPRVPADEKKMREALFIVFENAVRYNQPGGSVTVSTAADGGMFRIAIENTGIGISKEESEKIGTALFYRGKFAREAYPIGMGVGLSLVKAVLQAHRGSFSIGSAGPGRGARATVTLPLGR
jgi:signal transduction histidine kinase